MGMARGGGILFHQKIEQPQQVLFGCFGETDSVRRHIGFSVMPDLIRHPAFLSDWIPAFAGMTSPLIFDEVAHLPRVVRAGGFFADVFPGAFLRDRKSTRLNSSHLGISYA